MHTKLLIIGSGPAGYTAAIYAARASLKPLIVTGNEPGGQLTTTTDVENFPGFAKAVQGPQLMQDMEAQAKNVGAEIINDYIISVDLKTKPFKCVSASKKKYTADVVIISTGAQAKYLGLESEKKFLGYGVSGCATCDGFFYRNKDVAVVGGGNTAVEEAIYLSTLAKSVTLIHRRDSLRAEKVLQERLFKNRKIKIKWDHELDEVTGDEDPLSVTGIKIKHTKTGKVTDVKVDGVFIAIGHKPHTDMFKGQLKMDKEGYIITKPGTTDTNIKGVFAAGDVQDKIYRQAVTAAGTGCMAALDAEKLLNS